MVIYDPSQRLTHEVKTTTPEKSTVVFDPETRCKKTEGTGLAAANT